jgi:hypothetical protein
MGTILRFIGVVLLALPARAMRLDVVPPVALLGLGVGVLIALGLLVVVIGAVAVFVIRAIKKNRLAKSAPPAQDPPAAPK